MSQAEPEPTTTPSADPSDTEAFVRRRISDALEYRRQFEPEALLSLAFVSGRQWAVADRRTRQLLDITQTELGDRYQDVELVVADFIHEYRGTALGELQTDSDRPELIPPGDGKEDEEARLVADQTNRLLGAGWEHEWDGDQVIEQVRQYCVDMGVAAVRCRYDRAAGEPVNDSAGQQVQAPLDQNGQMLVKPDEARAFVADLASQGQTAKFEPVYRGKIVWEAGSFFNILAPPGVPHERGFPWECWVSIVSNDDLKAMYPAAANLRPDGDIGSALGVTVDSGTSGRAGAQNARVKDSNWLFTYYEQPTRRFKYGREVVLAGSVKRLMEERPTLPYQRPLSGEWCSGIAYFHWQRLSDRFYSRSLIDALKDPQRMTNRAATQEQEIVDRSMPYTVVEEGALPQKPAGKPGEFVEVKRGMTPPKDIPRPGPGAWMRQHREQLLEDASHASTISSLKLGENPAQVTTYSQLRLLYEQEGSKRSNIRVDHQNQVALLAEFSVQDIVRYWPDGKQLLVAGPQNTLQTVTFDRSIIPPLYVVRPAKGSPRPRSEAVQTKLISELWTAALNSQAAARDPDSWMKWLADSYDAGTPLPLPSSPSDVFADKASLENRAMQRGEQPPVAYYDPNQIHLPIHRRAQDEALMAGDERTWQRIENHCQEHLQNAAANMAVQQPPMPQPQATPAAPKGVASQPAQNGGGLAASPLGP